MLYVIHFQDLGATGAEFTRVLDNPDFDESRRAGRNPVAAEVLLYADPVAKDSPVEKYVEQFSVEEIERRRDSVVDNLHSLIDRRRDDMGMEQVATLFRTLSDLQDAHTIRVERDERLRSNKYMEANWEMIRYDPESGILLWE